VHALSSYARATNAWNVNWLERTHSSQHSGVSDGTPEEEHSGLRDAQPSTAHPCSSAEKQEPEPETVTISSCSPNSGDSRRGSPSTQSGERNRSGEQACDQVNGRSTPRESLPRKRSRTRSVLGWITRRRGCTQPPGHASNSASGSSSDSIASDSTSAAPLIDSQPSVDKASAEHASSDTMADDGSGCSSQNGKPAAAQPGQPGGSHCTCGAGTEVPPGPSSAAAAVDWESLNQSMVHSLHGIISTVITAMIARVSLEPPGDAPLRQETKVAWYALVCQGLAD
jgi:hypothetical protein